MEFENGCAVFSFRDLQREALAKHFEKTKNRTKMIEDYSIIGIMCGKDVETGRVSWPATTGYQMVKR